MKKQLSQADLLILCEDNNQDAALKIYNNDEKEVFYTSTRIAELKRHKDGYLFENADEFTGMKYELTLLGNKEVLNGVVNNESD